MIYIYINIYQKNINIYMYIYIYIYYIIQLCNSSTVPQEAPGRLIFRMFGCVPPNDPRKLPES